MFLLVLLADVARGQSPGLSAQDGSGNQTLSSATLSSRQSASFSLESRSHQSRQPASSRQAARNQATRTQTAETQPYDSTSSARELARERARNRTRELISTFQAARRVFVPSPSRNLFAATDLSGLLALSAFGPVEPPTGLGHPSQPVELALNLTGLSSGVFAHTASPAP